MTIQNIKLIMIMGCQRSGTTLTGQMIGAHRQCFMIDEPDGIYRFMDQYLGSAQTDNIELSSFITASASKYLDERSKITEIDEVIPYSIVAKVPNQTYNFEALAKLPTTPKIIYPVRDVRSVVASMLKLKKIPMIDNQLRRILNNSTVSKKFSNELQILSNNDTAIHVKAALIWKIKTSLFQYFELLGLNPLVFRYEDLATNPEKWSSKIASHCELPFDLNLLQHHELLVGVGPGNTERQRAIDVESLEKWRESLTEEQAEEVLEVGKELMWELGYL